MTRTRYPIPRRLKLFCNYVNAASETFPDHMELVTEREQALAVRARLEDARNAINLMISEADTKLLGMIQGEDRFKQIELPGGGVLKFTGNKEVERYNHEIIQDRFGKAIADELAKEKFRVVRPDGEITDPHPIVARVMDIMAKAVGVTPSFDGWRSGVAKQFGINLKEGAYMKPAEPKVRVESRDKDLL